MPSPEIPRSKSVPSIAYTQKSPSRRSSLSTGTTRSKSWSKKVAFRNFFTRKKASSSSSSKNNNPQLTEESLKEFNKQNETLKRDYSSTRSPYYKGLTDLTLDNNRQKLLSTTPGRESNYVASFISSTSKTNFVDKVQDWGNSCFSFKNKVDNKSSARPDDKTNVACSSSSRTEANVSAPSVRSKAAAETTTKAVKFKMRDDDTALLDNGKPLGEKKPEPMPPPPQPAPAPAPETSRASLKAPLSGKSISEKEMSVVTDERKYVWADQYRPSYLKDFLCNRSKALELLAAVKDGGDCHHGHLIFEGHPGVGKRTMIWAMLREIFGADNLEAREECKEFYLKGEAVSSIYVNVKASAKHVEVNLSELRGYERHVIVQLINEKRSPDKDAQCNCKAIILYGADRLSSDAMVYIRWLLERYKGGNTIFFCCSDASKLEPIKSICSVVQLLRPSVDEIVQVLEFIAEQERIELPQQLAVKIAENSKNNLRQAIRSFEATWHFNSFLYEGQEILTGWEDDIAHIARNIIKEQSPRQLYDIRGKLQNLIEHNVSPEFIFKMLVEEIKKNVKDELHQQINKLYWKYNKDVEQVPSERQDDDQVRKIIQQFMKIEEFIAKFMSWYKSLKDGGNLTRRNMKGLTDDIN